MHRLVCGSRASPTLRHRIAPPTAAMHTAACRESSHAPAPVPLRVPPTRTSRNTQKAEAGRHRSNPAAARFAMMPSPSVELQIGGRRLPAFHHNFVAHLLAIIQALQPSRLHGRDVHEYILAAILRHDETITLGGIEPLHGSNGHCCHSFRCASPVARERGCDCNAARLCELEVGRGRLAALHCYLVADLLAFIQAAEPSRLHCCDVDEHVLAAFLRHDEAEALGRVEPLDCTDSHRLRYSPSIASCNGARHWVDNQPFGA